MNLHTILSIAFIALLSRLNPSSIASTASNRLIASHPESPHRHPSASHPARPTSAPAILLYMAPICSFGAQSSQCNPAPVQCHPVALCWRVG
ncbi:hypothetical protein K443DRAFT_373728 [Laccaria amethystina LaAM-08-1]|uniref:Unplaced genomic scaffold K443scaffold_28, whole genome shotgun sequence n=1 Tax=Laccaria amethystina LaAM-08-1 TaxID=1095629 RepID=A0A0C9XJ79_9AGAR|nr:hypothetical protein K443DRAFT_373728 [Laccaria amethystina LaAM-08-1]